MIAKRGMAILWMTCLINVAVVATVLQPTQIGRYQTVRKEMTRKDLRVALEPNPKLIGKVDGVIEELSLDGAIDAFFMTRAHENTRLQALKAVPVLHTYPRGRQLLDLFKIDHLEVVHSTVLKPFVDLDQSYRDMKNHRISRGGSK